MEGAIGGGFTVGLTVNMKATSGEILMGARSSDPYTSDTFLNLKMTGESYTIPNMTLGTVYYTNGQATSEYFQ